MPLSVEPQGRVRQVTQGIDAEAIGSDQQLALTTQLELLVAQAAAPYREIVRMGRTFIVHTTAAIGAVVAVPTTAHMLALYNNEPDGGRSYVIDWIGCSNVVSTAVAASGNMLALVGQVREAIPTDAALTITKANGLGGLADTRARTILNATALPGTTGVAANWFAATPTFAKAGAAATPGYGHRENIDGRIIVPPGRYFAVHVLANVVGETFLAYISWHETQLTLG